MTYNRNRHEIIRKVRFSHCHLHSRCRSTPGTGHTSLCNICDKSPWFYCSCSLFAQHSCNVFAKRYIQDLHWDVRPGDDVRFPGWREQALVCVWSPIGWFSYLSPCWKVSRHWDRQDQECCTKLPTSHWRLGWVHSGHRVQQINTTFVAVVELYAGRFRLCLWHHSTTMMHRAEEKNRFCFFRLIANKISNISFLHGRFKEFWFVNVQFSFPYRNFTAVTSDCSNNLCSIANFSAKTIFVKKLSQQTL